jgi:hypothetical protein
MTSFAQHQQNFAAHIRNPEKHPAPVDIEDRRMAIYRDLFYNNVSGFVANAFPVLKAILPEARWNELTRDFFASHSCSSPLFSDIALEFIDYLQNECQAKPEDPAFMLELAHYEWVEMAVAISDEDKHAPEIDHNGDLLSSPPMLSPVMFNLSYQYPVHTISPNNIPQQEPTELTHLVVYRDRQDEVHFLQINAASQQLIESIKQNPEATGLDIITAIAEAMNHPDPNAVIDGGKQLLYSLREKNVIIGTRLETST